MTKLIATAALAIAGTAVLLAQTAPSTHPQASPTRQPAAAAAVAAQPPAGDTKTYRVFVDKYCVTCHNARLKTGGLLLDELDLSHLGDHAERGETIVRKLRAGLMPPSPMPRPDDKTMESLIRWMEGELDKSAATHLPAPGSPLRGAGHGCPATDQRGNPRNAAHLAARILTC